MNVYPVSRTRRTRLPWCWLAACAVVFAGASARLYGEHYATGFALASDDMDLASESTGTPDTPVSISGGTDGLGMAHAEFTVSLADASLGTFAHAHDGPMSGNARARLEDTVSVTLPAGIYAEGATAEVGVALEGMVDSPSGYGRAWQEWDFELFSTLDSDTFAGYISDSSPGWYDNSATLEVLLLAPGSTLNEEQTISFTISAALESWAEATDTDDWGMVNFMNTGSFTSLVLPTDNWTSESGQFGDSRSAFVTVKPAAVNPVPLPGAALLGLLGLGTAGVKLRRRFV